MNILELNLDSQDKNSLKERFKDLVRDNPTTSHPIDIPLQKMGLVTIQDGLTTLTRFAKLIYDQFMSKK